MARPINPNPPIHIDKTLRKRWDGRYYVLERRWQYNHSMKGNKHLGSVVIGVIENKSDPIESMIPIEEWNKRRQAEKELKKQSRSIENARKIKEKSKINYNSNKNNKVDITAPEINDTRQLERIAFPAQCLFLVILGAFSSGYTDCKTCEAYYNVRRKEFVEKFNNFPDVNISHDTLRRFIILLGKDKNNRLLSLFNEIIKDNILNFKENYDSDEVSLFGNTRIIATDGQAVRATKVRSGGKHSRSVLSYYDCTNNMVLEQAVVGAKTNEIPHALQLIEKIDISGAVITADALHTQVKFVKKIVTLGGDYVLPIKPNQLSTNENIDELFKKTGGVYDSVKVTDTRDYGHGKIAERTIAVLPGHLLEEDVYRKWTMLKEGCVAKLTTKFCNIANGEKTDETHYYISSLNFDEKYIAKKILHIIRSHWNIENKLHWVLDVVYSQDRTQCKNNEFFKGLTMMMKIMNNFVEAVKCIEENKTGKNISKSMLKAKLSNFPYFYNMYIQILAKNTV